MALALGVVFFLVPFLEIWVIIEVGTRIGWDATVTLLLLMSAAGAWLVKHEGMESWRRVQGGLQQGRMPTADVIDAFLVLVAGALLLCPGFITSGIGILLMLPPIRSRAGEVTSRWFRNRVRERVRLFGTRMGGPFTAGTPPRTEPPPSAQASDGPRAYRRPDEPFDDPSGTRVWGARVRRTNGADERDVIDVDGEEIVFGQGEIGPSGF